MTGSQPEPPDEPEAALKDAPRLFLTRRAATPEAEALVDALWEPLWAVSDRQNRPRSPVRIADHRRAVAALIGGLLAQYHAGQPEAHQGWGYVLKGRRHFTRHSVLNGDHVSYHQFDWAFRALHAAGLMDVKASHRHFFTSGAAAAAGATVKHGKQFATRVRATARLIDSTQAGGITVEAVADHFPVSEDATVNYAPITIREMNAWVAGRKQRGAPLRLPNTDNVRAAVAQVKDLNRFLLAHEITTTPKTPPVQLRRDFTRDLELHGRWYPVADSYQGQKAAVRGKTRIDGEPCIEIDVSASHLTCLHGYFGIAFDPESDPYAHTEDLPRYALKQWTTATFGHGHINWKKWSRDALREAKKDGNNLATYSPEAARRVMQHRFPILGEMRSRFGFLQDRYGHDVTPLSSLFLMNLEARALTAAMMTLKDAGIVALPVHDSLIVPRSREAEAAAALVQAFHQTLNITPRLKADGRRIVAM